MSEKKESKKTVLKPKAKKEKKQKQPKVEKKLGYKKLPSVFKKNYTQKAFENKINKKLYVSADKTYIAGLFKNSKDKKGNDVLAVSKESLFTKKEIKRLKTLAKEIKGNKGRFKVVPFAAVAVVIAGIGVTVTLFKNPVAKMAIVSSMQGIFGAKCDVGSVKVEIFGAQITVNNLAQASSSDEFKNIFEFEKLDLHFNLADLLRAKFHAQNIEVTGIKTGTERKSSGKIAKKQKSVKQKAQKNDSSGFYASLKEKAGTDPEAAKKAITDLFAMYDPNAIVSNVKDNLQSQKVAKEVEEELKTLVETWKNKPEELKKNVEQVQSATKSLTNLKVSNVKAAEIPALLKQIEEATTTVKNSKSDFEKTLSSFDSDQKKVKQLQKKLNDAVANDKALLSAQLSVLDVTKAKAAVSDTVNQAGFALLGEYYPYLKQLITYASSMKASSGNSKEAAAANKKAVESAKKESRRYAGRYVYWKKDTVPKLLIENIHGSGNGIDIAATNISSDMNKRGEPWIVKGSVAKNSCTHLANLTVDSRSASTSPLVSASYSGKNFPLVLDLAKSSGSDIAPKFDGSSTLTAGLSADSDFSFTGNAKLNMNPVSVTGGDIGSETATRIYTNALASIKTFSAGAKFSFSESKGVGMNIDTNFDTLLADALKNVADKELAAVKEQTMEKLNEQLGSSETASKYISQFSDISGQLNGQKSSFDTIQKQLSQKQDELKKQMASGAKDKAGQAASSALKGLLRK